MRAIAVGVVGAALIHVFYRGVQHKWPASYYAVGQAIDSIISRGIFRYLAFRLAPLYLVSILAGVTTDRLGGRPGIAITIITAIHLLQTNVHAAIPEISRLFRRFRPRVSLLLFHVTVSILLSGIAIIACLTLRYWRPLVPTPDKLSEALWTGVLAAVFAVYIQRLTAADPYIGEIVGRIRGEVGETLLSYARACAQEVDCDPVFLQALMLAEAHQRPGWFRRVERVKGRVIKSGTYGIMQVSSASPLTDEESIKITAQAYSGFYPQRTEYGSARSVIVTAAALEHNRDRQFASDVATIYQLLDDVPTAKSAVSSYDKRASIEITEIEAIGRTFRITGSAAVVGDGIEYLYRDSREKAVLGVAQSESMSERARGKWTVEVPVDSRIFVAVGSNGHDLLAKIEQGGEVTKDDFAPLGGDLVTVELNTY